jgi:[acyl-carrier-protein] S-malonyltransferase
MMTDFIEDYPVVRLSLERISDETSTDIISLCLTADARTLNDGKLSGLLVVASSVALFHLARQEGLTADAYAGYSVGQYTALYASGMLSLEEMLAVLTERQTALDDAAKMQASCMVAVLGVPLEKVIEIVTAFDGAAISNFNCPNNYSVACHVRDADALVARFTEADAVRALRLPVVGGWHSHFMLPAAHAIRPSLEGLALQAANGLFVDNVSGHALSDPEEIRSALFEHVYRPVQWEQSMRLLFKKGFTTFVELGYGDQLSRFVKFTDRKKQVFPTGNVQRFEHVISAVNVD